MPDTSPAPWWKSAVFYQIYPRSFSDSTGNGVGDLAGITRHLDHLCWLGVDALWISPFFRSPMADFGYDVSDYCDVDPIFGTLDDFDALLAACHERGLRVIIDWVPAHTSSEHPWFREARRSKSSPRRDWYVWRDPGPDGELPNNWRAAFGDRPPAWTLEPGTGQLYLHSFLAEQPDLNWENPDLRAAMHDTLRFWLDRGVDGFRADVVHNIGKDPELASVDPKLAAIPHCALNDEPATHPLLREIRALLDGYDGDRMMIGEVFLLDTAQVAAYYGRNDELHLSFNFPPMFAAWAADAWRQSIEQTCAVLDPIDAWPSWVLSNHDRPRHRTRYETEARARAASVLLLGLRGTPFLYMGEELGLEDAVVPEDRVVDPGGRDGCRAPIPWRSGGDRGWPGEPWLPWPPDADERSAERQRERPDSMLHLYRRVLAARRASPALQLGAQRLLDAPEGVLAWERRQGDDRRIVAINFRDVPADLDLGRGLEGVVSSRGRGEGDAWDGKLEGDEAVILAG
ncbi:MAG: alpha-amylase family glycosyl hydrolase [Myxococcota bacterium]